jgi:hypothetical protein
MIVKYVGPSSTGLEQVGYHQQRIEWGEPVDLPDELAERLLEQAPQHWETVAAKKSSAKKSKSATPAADVPEEAETS